MSFSRSTGVSVEPARQATGWRMWVASVAMMLCSWLSYVDRQILAVLSPLILRDTGLTAQSYGEVVSAFSIAYMIANPLWGSILDYVGLRIGMLAAVTIWTVASTAHSWMAGFLGFAAARALLGLGEGATFPGGLRASMDSLPPDRHSRGLAISYSGGSLGAILAPLVVVPIAVRFGWRAAFLFSGALGVAWLLMWTGVAQPPYLSPPERKAQRLAWPNPFERRFWALVTSYALGAIAIGPILYLSPLYLNRVLHFSESDLGKVLWIPPFGWELGYFFWGWAADRFARNQARPVGMFSCRGRSSPTDSRSRRTASSAARTSSPRSTSRGSRFRSRPCHGRVRRCWCYCCFSGRCSSPAAFRWWRCAPAPARTRARKRPWRAEPRRVHGRPSRPSRCPFWGIGSINTASPRSSGW